MIEILVTILILSFGLLGVAGLLSKGVSNASNSEARAKANQLLADMADRLRANSDAALSSTTPYVTGFTTALPTGTTIADQDVIAWKAAIAKQLPGGQGEIVNYVSGSPNNRKITISIQWNGCFGTISDANEASCGKDNAATSTYEKVSMEIML